MTAHPWRDPLLLALLAAALFLTNLGGTDLWSPDEPKYGEVAREMLADGHWVLPHVNGEVYTDKPPLHFWLIALASRVAGGVGSWSARLPGALAGIGSVLLTYAIGRRLLSRQAAFAGAAVFATSFLVFDKARSAQIDMTLCFLILAAIGCFVRAWSGQLETASGSTARDGAGGGKAPRAGRGWGLAFWTACALGVLAKGPVGLLLPLGAVLLFLSLESGWLARTDPRSGEPGDSGHPGGPDAPGGPGPSRLARALAAARGLGPRLLGAFAALAVACAFVPWGAPILVAVAFPALAVLALQGRPSLRRRMAVVSGPILFALIVGSWMAAAQAAGAAEGYSLAEAFSRHSVERFAEGMHHRQPFHYYLTVMPHGMFPWFLLVPGALVAAWKRARGGNGAGDRSAGALLLLCWMVFVLLFFTVSGEKRDLYILPLYPAAGLLVGLLLETAPATGRPSRWIGAPLWITAGTMTGLGLSGLLITEGTARGLGGGRVHAALDTWNGVFDTARLTLALLLPFGVAAIVTMWKRRSRAAALAIGAGACAGALAVALVLAPAFNQHKSHRPFAVQVARIVRSHIGPGDRIPAYGMVRYGPALSLYSGGIYWRHLASRREVRDLLDAPPPVFLVTRAQDEPEILALPGFDLEPVERARVGDVAFVLYARE